MDPRVKPEDDGVGAVGVVPFRLVQGHIWVLALRRQVRDIQVALRRPCRTHRAFPALSQHQLRRAKDAFRWLKIKRSG
jgi:hypothetical protein